MTQLRLVASARRVPCWRLADISLSNVLFLSWKSARAIRYRYCDPRSHRLGTTTRFITFKPHSDLTSHGTPLLAALCHWIFILGSEKKGGA